MTKITPKRKCSKLLDVDTANEEQLQAIMVLESTESKVRIGIKDQVISYHPDDIVRNRNKELFFEFVNYRIGVKSYLDGFDQGILTIYKVNDKYSYKIILTNY